MYRTGGVVCTDLGEGGGKGPPSPSLIRTSLGAWLLSRMLLTGSLPFN